jgi:peptidoglycan/LPS O-acetylase OafA/YrhL
VKSARIPELDGIRGIAIAMVLVWHYFVLLIIAKPATLLSYAQAAGRLTWTGVDLFFVLSGFLIGGILLDARSSSDYFQTFYTRRFFRIVPLYLIWFVLSCLVMRFVIDGAVGKWMHNETFSMWPYLFYLQNFWMASRNTLTSYSGGGTWSLAIEEQFYLTLPLVIRFAPRKLLPSIIGIGIVTAPILRLLIFFLMPHHRTALFVLTPARADSLLFGVLGAMTMRNDKWSLILRENGRWLGWFLTAFMIGAAYLTVNNGGLYSHAMISSVGYTWMAAFYLCLILFSVTQTQSRLAQVLRWGWLRWLGTIAYGVYLFHIQVLIGLYAILYSAPPERLETAGEWGAVISSLAITIGVCSASWIFFESRLVRLGHQWTYSKTRTPATSDQAHEVHP